MIHVYAVTDAASPRVGVTGIEGAPVEMVAAGGLHVATTRHDSTTLPATTDAILAHAGVCDELQQQGCTLLPVRFGARYADEATLRQAVGEREDAFAAALQHVRGRVEVGLRVATAETEQEAVDLPPPSSGAAYLQRRSVEEQQREANKAAAQAVADEIHELLRGCVVDAATKVQATPGLLLSAAYLIPADQVSSFADMVAEVSRRRSDLQLLCTGPWPPYHFAGEGVLA